MGGRRARTRSDPLALYMLGSFRIGLPARGWQATVPTPSSPLGTSQTQALPVFLVLHPGRHTRETPAMLFWSERSELQARISLRNAFAVLLRNIAPGLFGFRAGVEINPVFPLWVDAREPKLGLMRQVPQGPRQRTRPPASTATCSPISLATGSYRNATRYVRQAIPTKQSER